MQGCIMPRFKKTALSAAPGNSDAGDASVAPALAAPVSGCDPDWRERIELAKRAREDGKKARKGKPVTFRMHRPLSFGG